MDADDIRAWMADFILDGPDPARQPAFDAALAADPALREEWAELQAAAGLVDALPAEAWGPVDLEAMRDRMHVRLDPRAEDAALAELLAEPPVPEEALGAVWPQMLQASAWIRLLPEPDLNPHVLAVLRERIHDAVAAEEAVRPDLAEPVLDHETLRHLIAEFAEAGIDPARAALFKAGLRSHPDLAVEWREIAAGLRLAELLPVAESTPRQLRGLTTEIGAQVRADAPAVPRRRRLPAWRHTRLFASLALAASALGVVCIALALRPVGQAPHPAATAMALQPPAAAPAAPTQMVEAVPPAPAAARPGADDAAQAEAPAAGKPAHRSNTKAKRRGRGGDAKTAAPDLGDVEGPIGPGAARKPHAGVVIVSEGGEPGAATPVRPETQPVPPAAPTPQRP